MKGLFKVFALTLCVAFVFSLCACHPKNETALTVGDVQISSALYMCALIEADNEARSQIDQTKQSSTDSSSDTTSSVTDYFAEKIDGTEYTKWVKNRALEKCTEFAAYSIKCTENKVELDDEDKTQLDTYAGYYWDSYGYSNLYEPNGVSKDTYKKSLEYSYLSNAYFESIYGEGGTKAVDSAVVTQTIDDNFALADVLTVDISGKEEADVTTLKAQMNGYVSRLNKGESFETVYNEYYGKEAATSDTESTEEKPADSYATLMGSADTSYTNDSYDTVKAMAMNEVKYVESDSALTILIRKDLMADSYWQNNLKTSALSVLKQAEFEKEMSEFQKTLTVKKNNYAMNQFKVKNIIYPTAG